MENYSFMAYPMITIESIIKKCGGSDVIAQHAKNLKADSVRKWKLIGIPERHWQAVIKLHGARLNANKLHEVNLAARPDFFEAA